MFPHILDRYLMTAYIVRQFRKSLGLSQKKLGKKIGGNQGTISNVENPKHLANAADNGQRPVALEVFIKILIEGLGLSKLESDALAWLIDPDYSKSQGAQPTLSSLSNAAPTNEQRAQALRRCALQLLQRAVTSANEREGEEKLVRMLTGWEEKHQVTFRQRLFRMEDGPGQRLLVSKYPSILTSLTNVFDQVSLDDTNPLSEEGRRAIIELTTQRREAFRRNLKDFGERCIHSTESLQRYVREDFNHPFSCENRRAHVRNLIVLLKSFKQFEVGLAPAEPEMEFVIKSGTAASLRGTAREIRPSSGSVICGPLYIFWDDPTTVYSFVVDFEHAWDKIPDEQRDKDNVIAQLERLLVS